jgi:superfamily II DNA or RNA helicase
VSRESDIHSLPEQAPWFKALRAEVQRTTYRKGEDYAQSGRVSRLVREGSEIRAVVEGSSGENYSVRLEIADGRMASHCDCPAWDKYGPHCKHVVAAALEYLARLRINGADDRSAADPLALPGLAKVENWLGVSALPSLEFAYRLTPSSSASGQRHWVIDVRRQDAPGKGPVYVRRVLGAGTRISPADERVLVELASRETRYDGRVLLSDDELCDLMELLKQRRVIYRGTPLFFSSEPARPQIRLETQPDRAVAHLEIALPDGSNPGLNTVHLLAGRESYVIAGQSVYPIQPGFPSRLLRKWLLESSMTFPPGQLERVLAFFASHLPRFGIALRADGVEVEESVEPKFVLTLAGSAERVQAKLAARYGETAVAVSPFAMHLGYASGAASGSAKLYRRREEAERAAAKLLLERGFRFGAGTGTFELAGDSALEFWARDHQTLPPEWERYLADAPRVRFRPNLKPRVRVAMGGMGWFELEAEFVSEDQSIDLSAVRSWLASGRRFVPLKDGSFVQADAGELSKLADLLEESGALPDKKKTRVPLFQAPSLAMLSEQGLAEIEAKARKAISELRELDAIPLVAPPEKLKAVLRPYQRVGLSWLWFLHRHRLAGILADDMGLGKTLQALSLLQKAKDEEGKKPSLVVAPTSVLASWEREAERFAPDLSTVVWHGQERHQRAQRLKEIDLALTSYALVRRDVAELSKVSWRYLILDEAQFIKNADSATAQACKSLSSDAKLALTGTPLENRLSELWSIFDFAMPGFLGSLEHFSQRYEQPIQLHGHPEVRDRLQRKIRPFILRRLKGEVARDLPPKTESVAYCDLSAAQGELYREVLEDSRRKVYQSIDNVGFGRSRMSIFAALTRLRQVCCDPRLLKMPPGTPLPGSAKLERFDELIADLLAGGHRALVFSQFTQMLQLLTQYADERDIPYLYLDGRTRDRMTRVDQFNDPSGPPIFFISLKAGGTGLNLIGADYVIHYDPWWNPAVEQQATDRTHRIGQTKAVFSYKLIARGTVEEKILALQRRKKELAEGIVGSDALFGKLTEQDVKELLSLG